MGLQYLLFLQNIRESLGGAPDGFFQLITELGDSTALIVVVAIVYYALNKELGAYLAFNSLFGFVLNGFLKITACVYRPWILDPAIHPVESAIPGATGYSFPSGHSTLSTALWGGIAVKNRKKKAIMIPAVILWLLICFSRNYLGVHTPQDVVVACVLGIGLLFLIDRLFHLLEKKPELDVIICVVLILVGIALMLYAQFKAYPLDVDASGVLLADPEIMKTDTCSAAGASIGFAIGWVFERRVVKFRIEGGVLRRTLRVVFGVGSVLFVKEAAEIACLAVFAPALAAAISMILLMLWIFGVYPLLMTLVENRLTSGKRA